MAFNLRLRKSIKWLVSIQNEDGGWGVVEAQKSTIVNTAEALYVLKRGRYEHTDNYRKGIEFIEANTFKHVKSNGPRIRYVAFALIAFCESHYDIKHEFTQNCIDWLIDSKNSDNGWGASSQDNDSTIFCTFTALWALQHANIKDDILDPSYQWLLSRFTNHGWSLTEGNEISSVATAYASLCLVSSSKYAQHENILKAKEYLLKTTDWNLQDEVILGTIWKHCSYAWIIPALAALGEDPYCRTISEGVYVINELYTDNCWSEVPHSKNITTRSQFWAVHALDSLQEAFEPDKHVLRINATRKHETLTEPKFVTLGVHTNWTTILPTKIYKYSLYGLFLISIMFLFEFHRKLANLPDFCDTVIAALILFAIYYLIQQRKHLFPKASTAAKYLFIILTLNGFLFDFTFQKVLNFIVKIKDLILNANI